MDLHPRPQLRRRGWLDLGGLWGFAHDDADVGLIDGWHDDPHPFQRTIEVPYPPESARSGIADPSEHPVVWYRRMFRLSDVPDYRRGSRLIVHFGAVDYAARVWLNGNFVGRHDGGHSSFSFDLSPALHDGDEQLLVVRAEDQPLDLAQPRGKQHWESRPADIWYHRTTGIWQPVWLEAVAPTHIAEVAWTPDANRRAVRVRVTLNEPPRAPVRLGLRLSIGGHELVDDTWLVREEQIEREITLDTRSGDGARRRLLWTPSQPNLIDAQLRLEDARGADVDAVDSYFGLRSVETSDGLFLLNGRPTYLRLVLSQGYWPESHLAAPGADALRAEVEAVKALGFNGVRIHQKVEDPRFLYWCDRLGLLVWAEMANAYVFSDKAVRRFTQEWPEVVRRDYSHPSIVTWVPFNESWGVPNLPADAAQRDFVRAIYHLTRTLDPTRPVIANDGWEQLGSDIWGIHDYALDGDLLRERYGTSEALDATLRGRPQHLRAVLDDEPRGGRPVVLSEFGGLSFRPQPGTDWFGYGSVSSADEYLAKYEELVQALLDSPAVAGFCYTQLTDTEQETNGLLRADRSPKLDVERLREITTRPSRAIPGDVVDAARRAVLTRAAAVVPAASAQVDDSIDASATVATRSTALPSITPAPATASSA